MSKHRITFKDPIDQAILGMVRTQKWTYEAISRYFGMSKGKVIYRTHKLYKELGYKPHQYFSQQRHVVVLDRQAIVVLRVANIEIKSLCRKVIPRLDRIRNSDQNR